MASCISARASHLYNQERLLNISEALETKDVRAMIFLCNDLIGGQDKENIKDGKQLFECLQKKCYICEEDVFLLIELLYTIGRIDLLKKLETTKNHVENRLPASSKISEFRILLFKISEDLSTKELESIKFLLKDDLSIAKMDGASILDIFVQLEKDLKLGPENLEKLKQLLKTLKFNKLLKEIKSFEKRNQERPSQNLEVPFDNMSLEEVQLPSNSTEVDKLAQPEQKGFQPIEEATTSIPEKRPYVTLM